MIIMASLQDTESALREYIMKHFLPQIYETILAASSLSCPDDPLRVLESQLMAFQGHLNVDSIDWQRFVDDAEQHITSMTKSPVETIIVEQDELPYNLLEKAYSFYRRKVANSCFRGWKRLTVKRKSDALELDLKMEIAQRHYERKQQKVALIKWMNWLKFHKRSQAAAIEKLRTVLSHVHLKPIIVSWCHFVRESKKTKEYFESVLNPKLDLFETDSHKHQTGEGLSMLPSKLLLKVFQCLDLKDQMNCAEVCCTWKAVIQSGSLWSRINFSVEKDWITDVIVKQILQQYRPFVIHLNMRGCTSLNWTSFSCISECRNVQELNLSECSNITDMMVQRILEGCPNLLYLNLSCTPVTNRGLRELSRSCLSLQYLSLAYCYQFTDKGLQYLTTGKGCHNLVHLDLSGCTQMTVDGFTYISAGCPSLKHIVINDMPTLSDKCVMALVAKCRYLSAVSLLDTPHLSDDAFKAIAKVAKLRIFSTEGNDRMTDASWKALCRSSQGLRRLHAADCPRTTDTSLKSMSTLKNLQYLDISHCSRVGDVGMRYLTEGASATKLRELNVSHCSHINDISVKRIAQRLSKLYQLNVSYCESLSDSALEWLSGSSITSLDISGCNIQDQGLSALEGIHLKKMVLAECANITDTGIETFCKQVKGLEHLDVSHCVALSDQAIKILSFYCRGLVTLQMSGCPKMTDVAMQYLTSGLHYLRELDVSGCVLLTDRTLRYLERNCPPLRFITMAYCSGISKLAALRLQPRVQHWEHSSDDPPYWFGYNNVGQMVQPIRMACKTDDTWEGEDGERAPSDNKSRN